MTGSRSFLSPNRLEDYFCFVYVFMCPLSIMTLNIAEDADPSLQCANLIRQSELALGLRLGLEIDVVVVTVMQ